MFDPPPLSDAFANERRREPRRLVNLPARLQIDGAAPMQVRLLDMGTRGVACVTALSVQPGAICEVQFSLPRRGFDPATAVQVKVRVIGTVLSRASGGFRLGLEFLGLDQISYEAVKAYVAA